MSLGGVAPWKKGRWHFLLPMLCFWSITRLTARPRFQYPDHFRSHVDGHKICGDEFDCSRIFGPFFFGGGKGLLRIMIIGNPWNPLPFVPTHNQDSFVFFSWGGGGGGVFCLTKSQSDIIELELPLVEILKQQFQFPWLNRQPNLWGLNSNGLGFRFFFRLRLCLFGRQRQRSVGEAWAGVVEAGGEERRKDRKERKKYHYINPTWRAIPVSK